MRFNPISEQEADAGSSGLWPPGEYDYEIKEAEEKESKAGNEMVELRVWLFNSSGGRSLVFDWLTASEKASWKIRHFAASCGLLASYEKGSLMVADIVGRQGRCLVAVQKGTEQYPNDRNVIKDYVKGKVSAVARVPAPRSVATGDLDDEIPF